MALQLWTQKSVRAFQLCCQLDISRQCIEYLWGIAESGQSDSEGDELLDLDETSNADFTKWKILQRKISGFIRDSGETSWDDLRKLRWDSYKIQGSQDCKQLLITAELLQDGSYFRTLCFRVWYAMLFSKANS